MITAVFTTDNRNCIKGNNAEMLSFCPMLRVGLQQNMLQTVTFVKRYP